MNWLLVLMVWGYHGNPVTKMEFQTKFLCEKALKELTEVNQLPEKVAPVGAFGKCVQIHKVEKPAPAPEVVEITP